MKNEPVAWMAINKSTGIGYIQKDKPTRMNKTDNEYMALYEQTPVAWLARGENTNVFFDKETALAIDENATPLYLHPHSEESVKAKTLTDEEIKQLQRECIADAYAQAHFHGDKYINSQQAILNFARAILRKAQEK